MRVQAIYYLTCHYRYRNMYDTNVSISPSPALLETIGDLLHRRPVEAMVISGRGYSRALRFRLRFADDSTVFVKAATTPDTAKWLLMEQAAYRHLYILSCLPRYLGNGVQPNECGFPFLLLEDLGDAYWPPPWTPNHIRAVRAALDEIHAYRGEFLKTLNFLAEQEKDAPGWHTIAANPEPFLSLGYCSRLWLDRALPHLISASASAPLAGDTLLHLDVRSDNLAIRPDGTAVLFDWNWACRGNPEMDIAGWLPSLHSEGGPLPETLLPDAGGFAAWLSGFFASQAGLPTNPDAPRVRTVQKRQAESAIPWAVRALRLPPLDGTPG